MISAILTTLCLAPTALPIRVDGEGFLRLAKNGRLVYTTEAKLAAVGGNLGTADGAQFLPRLALNGATSDFEVDLQGNISAKGKSIGRIVLAAFPDNQVKEGMVPKLVNPGEGIYGVIRTGEPTPTTPTTPTKAPSPATPATVPANAKASVIVRANSEVTDVNFTIGDIADISGDSSLTDRISTVSMGASPMFGTSRGLVRSQILARLGLAHIDAAKVTVTVPEGAQVVRKAQTVTTEQLLEAAQRAVQTRHGISANFVAVKMPAPFNAPVGEVTFQAEAGAITATGVNVSVNALVGGKVVGSRAINLVPENPSLGVKSGDTVMVRLVTKGAVVELEGKATATGFLGQTVSVTVTVGTRPRTLSGVVKDAGVVEVNS